MKTLRHIMLALAMHFFAFEAFAQEPLKIFGMVTDEFDRPLVKIKISLKYIGSGESKARGEFFFVLPKDITSGMPVEFEVANDTLAIITPSRGIWNVPQQPRSQPVQIKLLRKGDHRFLSKMEMKKLMNEVIQERAKKETRLQARVNQLEQQLAEAPKDPLAEEAKRLGFSKEALLAAIEKAKQLLQESDDSYEVALAKLYNKHFGEAARLIEQSIQRSEKIIGAAEREKQELPEKYLNLGNAWAGEHDLKGAIAAYQKVIELQPANGKAYFQLGWAQLSNRDYQAVIKNWKSAIAIFRSQSSSEAKRDEAEVLGNFWVVFSIIGESDSALGSLHAALKIVREIGDRDNEAENLFNLWQLYRYWDLPDSANFYLNAALQIYGESCSEKGFLLHLRAVCVASDMLEQAHYYFKRCLRIAEEIRSPLREKPTDQINHINVHVNRSLINLGNAQKRQGQLDSAKIYYKLALRDSRTFSYREGESSALENLVQLFSDLGQPDSVYAYHQNTLQLARETGYREGEANQLHSLGLWFQDLGKPDSARVYHQNSIKIYREIGNRQGEAQGLIALGTVFAAFSSEHDSAIAYYRAALKIHKEVGFRSGEATALGNLGLEFRTLGKPDSARIYLKTVLKIHRELGDRKGEAADLGNLGLVFSNLGKPDSARVYHQAALTIAREIGDRENISHQLGNLGSVFDDLGKPDSARVYHQVALKIAREIGDRWNEANRLGLLGSVFSDLKQPDSAIVYLQAALKIHHEINYRRGEAADLVILAPLFQNLGRLDSARVLWQAALKIYREIGNRESEGNALGNLGLVFNNLGKPDSAIVYLQAALKIHREIGYRYGEAIALGHLGILHKDVGKFEQARQYLKQSLKTSENVKSFDRQWVSAQLNETNAQVNQALLDFGDNLAKRGQLDSAIIHYNLALQDSRNHSYREGESSSLNRLSFLFHQQQFKFSEAFAIDQLRVQLESVNTSTRAEFAEKHFTTGRFAAVEKRLTALLANPEASASTKIALRAISIANVLAQNKTQQVPAALETLQQSIAAQPDTFKVGWTFEGTKHFISVEPKLARYREWLLQLFAAVEIKEGREAILAALREVRERFQAVGKRD